MNDVNKRIYLELKKDSFMGFHSVVIGYSLKHVTIGSHYHDDSGYSFIKCIDEDENILNLKSEFIFTNEESARNHANEILEMNKKIMVNYYQKIMSNIEQIDKAILSK
jgi:hypothetical protein